MNRAQEVTLSFLSTPIEGSARMVEVLKSPAVFSKPLSPTHSARIYYLFTTHKEPITEKYRKSFVPLPSTLDFNVICKVPFFI